MPGQFPGHEPTGCLIGLSSAAIRCYFQEPQLGFWGTWMFSRFERIHIQHFPAWNQWHDPAAEKAFQSVGGRYICRTKGPRYSDETTRHHWCGRRRSSVVPMIDQAPWDLWLTRGRRESRRRNLLKKVKDILSNGLLYI